MELLKLTFAHLILFFIKSCVSQTTVPPPVDCTPGSLTGTLQLNSPQFATLCQIKGNLTAQNLTTPLLKLVGYTADQICDGDCRCVMGATAAGGRCAARSDGGVYCKCDYSTTATPPIFPGTCGGVLGETVTKAICGAGSPLTPIFQKACNSDCQCSHGYGNTGNHNCTTDNGQTGNTKVYCVCENHTNIS